MNIENINLVKVPKSITPSGELSLLDSYMAQKEENYTPQERKQTSKEKFINFSKKKYLASLFFLKIGGSNLKAIANAVKVNYGLLRKWTTEKEFNKLVHNHHCEFVQLFFKHLESKTEKQSKLFDGFLKKPVGEIAEKECPQLGIEEYRDIAQYNDILQDNILITLGNISGELGKLTKRSLRISKKLYNYFVKKKPLSKGETLEGLMKEKDEINDREAKIFPLVYGEGDEVLNLLSVASKTSPRKRKYSVLSNIKDPKAYPSKSVTSFSNPISNQFKLEIAKFALIHSSWSIKKKDGKKVMKQAPVKEIDRKRAVYLISQVIRNME